MNLISTYQQYEDFVALGFQPLVDWRKFEIEIRLRVELQRQLFGHRILTKADDLVKANDRFYRWVFEHKQQVCEETGVPIYGYSAVHLSHIITRGSHPEMAHDPRNINILTLKAHNRWESGNNKGMKIFPLNQYIIRMLIDDYKSLM